MNAPFLLYTTADSPQRLFGQAVIGGPNCVLFTSCNVGVVSQGAGAVVQGTLGQSNSIGILVQRVVGTKKAHGTRTLVVRNVGRVPLGRHHKGKVTIHWNLKVNGHRLRPGRYLITLRALDRHGNVLGVTKSVVFRVTH